MRSIVYSVITMTALSISTPAFSFNNELPPNQIKEFKTEANSNSFFKSFALETSFLTKHMLDKDGKYVVYENNEYNKYDYNENNHVVGLLFNVNDRVSVTATMFENSYFEDSWTVGLELQMLDSKYVDLNIGAGFVNGYTKNQIGLDFGNNTGIYVSPSLTINILSANQYNWQFGAIDKANQHQLNMTNRFLGEAYVAGIQYKYVY